MICDNFFFFFFQAEDGIRDIGVTGVQTCALPISSSGGICAFTAAWERPDMFSKVLSHVGSFTNIRGGDVYPSLIRKTEKKPIRVFLQAGKRDLDNEHGNWPL